jgi:putative endonuclease
VVRWKRQEGPEEWFVYILRCADDSFYTGITKDVVRRWNKHSAGKAAKYTRPASRRPVVLIYLRLLGTHESALTEERRIKKLSRAKKKLLVTGGDRP